MKILKPAIPFAERWYAVPITCPNCNCEFMIEEDDILPSDAMHFDASRPYMVSDKGIGGTCPCCKSDIYIERPE